MREILFRAKRIDDGKWVEGDLSRCAVVGETHIRRIEDNLSTTTHRVAPETVCQYTGYTDLRKKKVFEHDIVFYEDGGCCGHIVFKEGRFLIEWEEARPDLRNDIHFWFENRRMYVTSNIFDNPELVESNA